MPNVLACLVYDHDLRLVVMAAVILAAGCGAFSALSGRLRDSKNRPRWIMVAFAACVMSTTTWATHFVAMVGYRLSDEPKHYMLGLTLASVLLIFPSAMLGIGLALYKPTRLFRITGGAILGGGVAAMHYCGMSALQIPFGITWHVPAVILSILIGMVFSAASLEVTFGKLLWERRPLISKTVATLLMVLAIVGLHFTGMSAVTVYSLASNSLIFGIDEVMLATAIACLSIAVTAMALSMSFGDDPRKLWRRYAIALSLFFSTGIIIFLMGSGVEAERTAYSETTQLVKKIETRLVEITAEAERQHGLFETGQEGPEFENKLKDHLVAFEHEYKALLESLEKLPERDSLKDTFYKYDPTSSQESLGDASQNFIWIVSRTIPKGEHSTSTIALYSVELLERYDAIANTLMRSSGAIDSRSEITWFFMGASSLLVFAFQGLAIFWPAHRSITRTLDSLEAGKQTAERLAIVAEHTSDAVFIADEHGQIEWSNTASLSLLKTSHEELRKKCLKDLLARDHTSRQTTILKTAENFKRGDPVHVQTLLENEEGVTLWVSLSLSPIYDKGGELMRVIAVARDISEQKSLEAKVLQHNDDLAREVRERTQTILSQSLKLEQALASERELNQMQSEFVSVASHEFRTPLTIIDGLARRLDKRL